MWSNSYFPNLSSWGSYLSRLAKSLISSSLQPFLLSLLGATLPTNRQSLLSLKCLRGQPCFRRCSKNCKVTPAHEHTTSWELLLHQSTDNILPYDMNTPFGSLLEQVSWSFLSSLPQVQSFFLKAWHSARVIWHQRTFHFSHKCQPGPSLSLHYSNLAGLQLECA